MEDDDKKEMHNKFNNIDDNKIILSNDKLNDENKQNSKEEIIKCIEKIKNSVHKLTKDLELFMKNIELNCKINNNTNLQCSNYGKVYSCKFAGFEMIFKSQSDQDEHVNNTHMGKAYSLSYTNCEKKLQI
ncbi:unnamed protein product [Cunninghamella echinulata]